MKRRFCKRLTRGNDTLGLVEPHLLQVRLQHAGNIPVLLIFLVFISFGLSAARKRCGLSGLMPFIICTVYLFVTAAGRYSGWRFALPADWLYYFYFAMGAAELACQAAAALGEKHEFHPAVVSPDTAYQPVYPGAAAFILAVFIIFGAVPALCRAFVPRKVFQHSSEENIRELGLLFQDHPDKYARVEGLLASPDKSVISGRIIYPRYFDAFGSLASGHPWAAYRSYNYPRLGFVLLNEENYDVILPAAVCPSFIPNVSEAYVIGEKEDDGTFLADAVIIQRKKSNAAPRILTAVKEEYTQ